MYLTGPISTKPQVPRQSIKGVNFYQLRVHVFTKNLYDSRLRVGISDFIICDLSPFLLKIPQTILAQQKLTCSNMMKASNDEMKRKMFRFGW